MTLGRRLMTDGIYTFALRMANMVFAAGLGILTARVLGPHGRGEYAMPMVAAALVSAAFTGITSAVSYYMLRENAGRGVLAPTMLASLVFLLAGALAVYVVAAGEHATWAALPAALSLPGTIGIVIAAGYAVGMKRVRATSSQAVLTTLSSIAIVALAFAFFGGNSSVAIAAWVVSTDVVGIGLLGWVFFDARHLPWTPVSFKHYLWYAMRAGSVSLVSLLNYRADVYVVAVLTTPAMLGIYTVAVTAAETLLKATQVTQIVVSPHVASMDGEASAELVARAVRANVLIAGITSAGLAVIAPFAVTILYGPAFLPMVPALRILLVGVFALSLGSPMAAYFTLRMGKPEVALVLASLSAVLCIVLSLVLVPRIGLLGAAIASTAAYLVTQANAIWYFSRAADVRLSAIVIPRMSDVRAWIRVFNSIVRRTPQSRGVA